MTSPELDQLTATFRDVVDHYVTEHRDKLAQGVSSERVQANLVATLVDSDLNRSSLAAIAAAAIAQSAVRPTSGERSRG